MLSSTTAGPFKPQPSRPLMPDEIVKRRPVASPSTPISLFPTTSALPLTTIGPPPKKVLTIVSWNVQVYEASKATANPYVNGIISMILAALDADICLLLETRDDVSVNLSAVEHRLANPSSHKSDETTEEEWDLAELELESIEHLKNVEAMAAAPLGFFMLGTDLTGKRYKPPARVFLYDSPNTNKIWPKMNKGFSITGKNTYNGLWKQIYWGSDTFRAYYDPYSAALDALIADLRTIPLTSKGEADVEFRLKRCASCGKHLGESVDCAGCADFNPFSGPLENLRKELGSFAFQLGGAQLETYGVLARSHSSVSIDGMIQMKDKEAKANGYACQVMRHTPPPLHPFTQNERYTEFCFGKRLTGAPTAVDMWNALQNDLKVRGINPDELQLKAKLDALNIPTRITPAPTPIEEKDRVQWVRLKWPDEPDPGIALFKAVSLLGQDPGKMTAAQLLDAVGAPNQVVWPERDASLEERAKIFALVNPTLTPDQALVNAGEKPEIVTLDAGLNAIQYPTAPSKGALLPYLDPGSSTYGRSPFVLPMSAILSNETSETIFPVVGFHSPYGADTRKDLEMRVEALEQLLAADPGDKKAFGDQDDAILIGDLNLDLAASSTNMFGQTAQDGYQRMAKAGFKYAIPKVPSSLKMCYSNTWKKDKAATKYDGVDYKSMKGDVTAFTSSAYDNILIKGAKLQSRVVTAAVVDVLGWIKQQVTRGVIDPAGAQAEWSGFAALDDDQKAFFIYRCFVSDHLPVVLDIEVEPLQAKFNFTQQGLVRYKQRQYARSKVQLVEIKYASCDWVDHCPVAHGVELETERSKFYIGQVCGKTDSTFTLNTESNLVTLPAPNKIIGMVDMNLAAAAVWMKPRLDQTSYTHILVGCSTASESIVVIDPSDKSALLIGRVSRISRDKARFRLQVDRYRCTLPVPDTWTEPPIVGSYVLALLSGFDFKEIAVTV